MISTSLMQFTKNNLNQTLWVHPHYLSSHASWYVVDAAWKTLGKLAVEIARKLSWKDKAHYCDHWDCGDYVVVVNVEKIHTTGNKMADKIYYKHTWWKGHLKEITLWKLMEKDPTQVLHLAVKGMLPKNKMRKSRLKRLKLFVGNTHAYAWQNLISMDKDPAFAKQQVLHQQQ